MRIQSYHSEGTVDSGPIRTHLLGDLVLVSASYSTGFHPELRSDERRLPSTCDCFRSDRSIQLDTVSSHNIHILQRRQHVRVTHFESCVLPEIMLAHPFECLLIYRANCNTNCARKYAEQTNKILCWGKISLIKTWFSINIMRPYVFAWWITLKKSASSSTSDICR